MAVRTYEELLQDFSDIVGESTEDNVIQFMENINDTLSDFERRISDTGDWEQRYNELDAEWRRRYRDRFFSAEPESPLQTETVVEQEEKTTEEKTTFDELFD